MATQANHTWKPSTARLLTITGFAPRPRGTHPAAQANAWPAKDPADVLDYSYDISPALWGDEGDSIAFLDVTILPSAAGDLTLKSSNADGRCAVLWLGGGLSGQTYAVTLAIGTVAGRSFQRNVYLPCVALSTEPVPGTGLITETGAPILDGSGNPLFVES